MQSQKRSGIFRILLSPFLSLFMFLNLGYQFLQVVYHDFIFADLRMLFAADIILKLDQLLLAVNKKSVEPGVDSLNTTKFTRTEQHVLEGEDNSPSDGSTIKPAKDVLPGEEWTDIGKRRE